jgi:hypothetical protein
VVEVEQLEARKRECLVELGINTRAGVVPLRGVGAGLEANKHLSGNEVPRPRLAHSCEARLRRLGRQPFDLTRQADGAEERTAAEEGYES